MERRLISKILASIILITLIVANIALLRTEVYALNTNLEAQGISTNNASVNFDAYFKDEKGNKTHTLSTDINQEAMLYFYVSVGEGYLKETKIKIDNPNFTLISDKTNYDEIEKIDTSSNEITLNKIRNGETIELAIPVKLNKNDEISLDMFSKETGIEINGLLVKNNSKTTKISKTIKVKKEWFGTAEINLEQGVIKYVPFEQGEEKGIVLQTKIKTNLKNSNLPIEKTKIQATIPTINGISPKNIYVTAETTGSTNGKKGEDTNNLNWNKKEDTINIEVTNPQNNNKIIWKKDCIDEYILTFIYGEEALTSIKQGEAKTTLEAKAEITAYNLENLKITKESKIAGTLKEKLNEIVMFNVETQKEIEKGYMYTGYETEYKEKITVDIANENLVDNLIIEEKENKYLANEQEYIAQTKYLKTQINKDNFKKMLGEDGYIKIYNQNNEQIAEINKNTQTDENNNYIINHNQETTKIKIETSKIKTVGKLQIENTKKITQQNYEKEQIKTFKNLQTNIIGKVNYKENEIIKEEKTNTSTLVEPTIKSKTILSNDTLSTIVENENVELRTILKSSDITCKLYSNPKILIKLPQYVENVSFNEAIKILFTDELEIATGTYNEETKTIEVTLNGTQTKYNDVSIAEGATILLSLNIKLNKLTPTITDEITTTIINEEETVETKTQVNYVAPVGMVTVNEISGYNQNSETATSVSGQESTGKIDTNSNAKTAIVTLTLINNNTNNCKNIAILGRTPFEKNTSITTKEDLGSTFTAELISTINAIKGIDNSKITVYYSNNGDATKDLTDENNGWTLTPENLGAVKSYLITINEYEMKTGETLSFEYKTQIPEGLRNDEKTYGTFVVYYDNIIAKETITNNNTITNENQNSVTNNVGTIIDNPQNEINTTVPNNNNNTIQNNTISNNTIIENNNIGVMQNNTVQNNNTITNNTIQNNKINEVLIPSQAQATSVGVGTESLPDIDIILTSNVEDGSYVQEGDIIKYTATVTNTGKTTLNDVKISIPIPQGTTYRYLQIGDAYSSDEYILDTQVKEITKTLNIEAGKTITITFEVQVNEMNSEIQNVEVQAKTIIGEYENTSSKITNPIEEGYLSINLFTYYNSRAMYKKGDTITYIGEVKNVNSTEKTNIVIKNTLPNGVTFEDAGYFYTDDVNKHRVSYNNENNTVTWKISSIESNESIKVILKVKVDNNDISEITNNMYAICEQSSIKEYSNDLKVKIVKENISVEHYTDVNKEYVDVGDLINYYIKVENNGTGIATNLKVINYLSERMKFEKLVYTIGNYTSDEITSYKTNEIDITRNLASGETMLIKITAKVKELEEKAKGTIELTNYAKVSADNIEEITTNSITHKIKVKEQDPEKRKAEISGIAWKDESRDGKRDDNEELLRNIEVSLITKKDAKLVKTVKTDKNGEYIFKDVENGEYLVVFKFDTTKYEITKYQVEGINEGKNSDAALQQTTTLSDGKIIEGAVTNTIKVQDTNIYNIDIGLLESAKFDLSLTKTISKITKQDDEGIKTYDYTGKDKTLAKIEIPSKQVNKTTVIVEYTIKVKNEGNIPGYAKQIVDYLPKDLKFASELNKDWYKSTDGNLYNKSLADTVINPGETKEIKLLATKVTTENNLGTTNNSAEIYESYNDYGVQDSDSTSGNKVTKEDDYGSADLVISLNTGTIIMYTGLIITIIATIGVGIYMIKKNVLTK